MNFRNARSLQALTWLATLTLLGGAVFGQDAVVAPPAGPQAEAVAKLKISDVESQIAKIESSGLEASAQDSLKGKFSEVIDRLKGAETNEESANYFRDAMVVAPSEVIQIQREIDSMPTPEKAATVDRSIGLEELRKSLDVARAELADISAQLERAEDELVRVRSRPVEIGERLPKARIELADADARFKGVSGSGDESLSKVADRMGVQAAMQALAAEVDMLSQEQLSQSVRESRRLAQRDLLQRKRENKRALYGALEERLKQLMVIDTKALEARIKVLAEESGKKVPKWDAQMDELHMLVGELKTSGQNLGKVSSDHRDLEKRRDRVWQDYQRIQEQVRLGAVDGSLSQVLMRQMRRLPNPRPLTNSIALHEGRVREFMLSNYRIDEKQREQSVLSREHDGDVAWSQALAIRKELLSKLRENYGELVRESARFETDERAYRDLIVEFQKYLSARLFGQRSSPFVGTGVLRDIPEAVSWSFNAKNWGQFNEAFRTIPIRQPFPSWMVGLVVGVLLLFRRRLIRSLENSGKRIKKISTDRYSHTLRAFLYSILLALPLPLVVGFIGLGVLSHPEESDWVRGFGQGLVWSALFLFWVLALRQVSRPGGLGEAHLNWNADSCRTIRRTMLWLIFTYTPLSLIASMTIFEESAKHFDSAGRLAFVLAHITIVIAFVYLFSPSKGVFAYALNQASEKAVWRFRWVLFPLVVGIPVALVMLAFIGYLWTSLVLSLEFQGTMRIVMVGVILYGLLVRWFTIRQRRLALEEALEARRARRAQAEKVDELEVESDVPDFLEVSEEELQLDDVFAQTRRLLRVVVGIVTVVMIWMLWANTLPLDRATKVAISGEGLSWFSFLQLALLIPIAFSIVKNLPGLMDLAGLRSSGLDSGTRFALTTICQYVITAIALAYVFKLLDLDWSQFGWIAAALSVGLGFGLQEVVANFVCGVIILFERPVRIGDVVSLGDVTGTITRIRMRATTITDWDRKDFIVPNKEFITGSLMNWTLSSPVNRLVIPVGVAYGTDTRMARDILLEIAEANPLVLEDPKPIASFEEFADSTLNLNLRCYLPNMDNRLRARTELCEAIDERFKAAGIEIAFPQRDLNLRAIDPTIFSAAKGEIGPKA